MATKAPESTEAKEGAMPFLDHLEELRRRLFYCAVAILIGGLIAWALFAITPKYLGWAHPLEFLQRPILPYLPPGERLITLNLQEGFMITLNVGFWIAVVIASPVILLQLWKFVAPAMYEHERRIAIPVVMAMVLLFVIGCILGFEYVYPMTAKFFVGISEEAFNTQLQATQYYSGLTFTCIGCGLIFELPLAMMGLAVIGIAKSAFLKKYRRHGIIVCLIASAAITPDPTTMFILGVPIYALFEVSIWLVALIERRKQRREERSKDDEPPTTPPVEYRETPLRLGDLA